MKWSRRELMVGASLSALLSRKAEARFPHGNYIAIKSGWNTLPLGAGGLVTGMHIANDGSMVCRTDVGNIYRWSGLTTDYADGSKQWLPLLTYSSLGSSAVCANNLGGWEHVLAPGSSNVHVAIFSDMTGVAGKHWIWYSTNSGATWNKSNIAFTGYSAGSNEPPGANYKTSYYKIAVDPANANVAYCGMPVSSGNTAGVYTSLNQAGGSTLATWTSVKTSGATPIGGVTNIISCGLAIDASSGTTTVGGQTVTNRIILPVGGVGIYESTNGGVSFNEIAVTPFGTSNFYVTNGGFTAAGVYYCVVVSATAAAGIWRYASGTWTNITSGTYAGGTFNQYVFLIIDPRNNPTSKAYLSVTGPNGIGAGYTSTNANSGSPVVWIGRTGRQYPYLIAAPYDIGYINTLFGQQSSSAFAFGTAACVDVNGVCWWPGNQSLFYFGTSRTDSTPGALPNYGSSIYTYSWSMGRGQESAVSQDVLCPPGGAYPVLAAQDLGCPMRGTFTTYPLTMAVPFQEWTNENLEYAANDPSFIISRTTGQAGNSAIIDASCYSASYGADGTWVTIANVPPYNASIRATISNGSGAAGFILNVTAVTGTIIPTAFIYTGTTGGTYYGIVQPYGTSGTSGTGSTGTYILDASSLVASPTALHSVMFVQGGQTAAVDHDHWITVPAGFGGQSYFPAYTTNVTTSATWSFCSGLPLARWMLRGWTFGATSKPLAVGYGADLGTVWACLFPYQAKGTARLYRSTNSGASFSSIATWTVGIATGVYCLSVPGFPNELWITGLFTAGATSLTGLWHITNANTASATVTQVSTPARAAASTALTLGAPSSPGGYPTLYLLGYTGYGATQYLYQGAYAAGSVTWRLFGPTGTQQDLPASCQLAGIQSIHGDWNVYQRLYVSSQASGFAYYNP
jgi:hypothetical protein